VVGSAIVARIADSLDANGKPTPRLKAHVLELVRDLAAGVRSARVAQKRSGAA
jgi:tryptophan synthase alpha chain